MGSGTQCFCDISQRSQILSFNADCGSTLLFVKFIASKLRSSKLSLRNNLKPSKKSHQKIPTRSIRLIPSTLMSVLSRSMTSKSFERLRERIAKERYGVHKNSFRRICYVAAVRSYTSVGHIKKKDSSRDHGRLIEERNWLSRLNSHT